MIDERIDKILSSGSLHHLSDIINEEMKPVDVARLIESSPPKTRRVLWEMIAKDKTGEVLQDLDDGLRADFLAELGADEIAESMNNLSDDDITDLLRQLPSLITEQVMISMEADSRSRVEKLLDYPDGTVGSIMSTEFITLPPYLELSVVLRYLRRSEKITISASKLIVVDSHNHFVGILPLTTLVQSQPSQRVSDVMDTDIETLGPADETKRAIEVIERYDLISVPVTDEQGKFLGMITVDDVFDLALEERDKALLSGAGLDNDQDTFAPLTKIANRRIFWLGINLVTVITASFFIGIFQDALDSIVALAVLMPIVASMGGIIGIQSMTIMIRAQALGHITASNVRWLFTRETLLGIFNGLIWAGVVSVISYLWFNDYIVTLALSSAMILNLLVGSTLGVLLPLFLEKNEIDPANAGGVLLTTVTDIVGFVAFLGIASLLI